MNRLAPIKIEPTQTLLIGSNMDAFVTRTRSRSPSPIRAPQPVYLGVLGSRNDMKMNDICEKVLHPLIDVFGKMPEKVLLQTEGNSNVYIENWAEKQNIPTTMYYTDWRRDGKRARILRDNKILTEATHIVCVNGPRSEYYEKLGARWLKKKSGIFVLDFPTQELAQLE